MASRGGGPMNSVAEMEVPPEVQSRGGGGATAAAKPVAAGTELAPGAEQPPGAADGIHADCDASSIVRGAEACES